MKSFSKHKSFCIHGRGQWRERRALVAPLIAGMQRHVPRLHKHRASRAFHLSARIDRVSDVAVHGAAVPHVIVHQMRRANCALRLSQNAKLVMAPHCAVSGAARSSSASILREQDSHTLQAAQPDSSILFTEASSYMALMATTAF